MSTGRANHVSDRGSWGAAVERARRAALAWHTGNAAALFVYFGPSTAGLPPWVRLERALVLRRRVRLALEGADATRRRHKQQRKLMKEVLAVVVLGALALGQRQARPNLPGSSNGQSAGPSDRPIELNRAPRHEQPQDRADIGVRT